MVESLKLQKQQVKKLAKGVRKARKEANLTQGQLAAKVGVGLQQISHLERGDNLPSFALYVSLCFALGFKRVPLVGDKPEEPVPVPADAG